MRGKNRLKQTKVIDHSWYKWHKK